MAVFKDELLRTAHEMRQQGEFEWARLVHNAYEKINTLEKDLENCRVINELLSRKTQDE